MEGGAVNKNINEFIRAIKSEFENLNIYQEITARYFVSKYMEKSDMILLYWDMGSGKTIGSLLCAIRALDASAKHDYKRIVILSPKSIQGVFDGNLRRLCNIIYDGPMMKNKMYNYYKSKIYMIPYNAWNSNEQLDDIPNLEHSIFIIDEVHLFIKSVIKVNITPENMKSKDVQNKGNAKRMYDRIRRLKDKKILCLTGTPLAKFSFEMVPLFNLAHRDEDLFKENYIEFQEKYYDEETQKLKPKAEEEILRKIDGMVSYVPPIDTGVKVSPLKEVLVEMSEGQFKQYVYDYCLELQENGYSSSVNMFGMPFGSVSTYHTKTFQDCLYWNSELDISDYNEVVFEDSKKIKGGEVKEKIKEQIQEQAPIIQLHHNMSDYLKDRMSGGGSTEYSSDVRHKIKKFIIDKTHCAKLIRMYEDSKKFDGIKCFYFRLTQTYGCDTMEKLLQKEGYELADTTIPLTTKAKRYVLFTGSVSQEKRNEYLALVNSKKNTHGEYIQYVILSPSGQVGISLMNVRFLGIGTAEFTYSSLLQIQTRCVRFKSHNALDPKDRTLEQRIYFSSPNKAYFNKHKKKLSEILSRTDPLIKDEKHPTIERIIYYNSIRDDIPMQAFRKLLYKASITEKLFKFTSR